MKRLLKSAKAQAALAGILVTLVLLATGQIDGPTATTAISGLIAVLVGSFAYEDGQEKRSQTPPDRA